MCTAPSLYTRIFYVCVCVVCVFVCELRQHLHPCVVYRAGTSVHCGLIELLPHSEGDVSGAD